MIPATPGRAENKAVIEGEFGKYEQAVGPLYLDDSSIENLQRSAVSEAIRAYCAGINQAGRAEFEGKSRQQVLREACPDPHADQAFIEHLHGEHTRQSRSKPLASQALARQILDAGFTQFELEASDTQGKLRTWLSGRYTPAGPCLGTIGYTGPRPRDCRRRQLCEFQGRRAALMSVHEDTRA